MLSGLPADALRLLASSETFTPHGQDYLWRPHLVWMHALSGVALAAAFFIIPLSLLNLARKRPDHGLNTAIYVSCVFLALCGLLTLAEVYTIWEPVYDAQGLLKAVTALAAGAAAIALRRQLPKLFAAPSLSQLEKANEALERANAALRISEERLGLAVSGGDIGLWDWDIATNEVWYSDVWLAHLGYEPGELSCRCETWEAHLHPDDRERAVSEVNAHLKTGGVFKSQFRMRTKTGGYVWTESFGVLVRDEKGEPVRMAGTLINITQRKKRELENEENRLFLSSVLENIQDGIVACNEKGELTLFNLAARQFHGKGVRPVRPEEWASRYALFEPDGVTPLTLQRIPLFRALSGEIVESQEIVVAPKNLPARRFIAKAKPLMNARGDKIGAVGGMHDITAEREREEALKRSNSELENFARAASHDLQEPLRKLVTFSEFLKEDLGDNLNERAKADIDAICDSAARMKQLVGDILELSRLKGSEGPPCKVNPRDCIDTVMHRLTQDRLSGAEFSYEDLPEVLADATLLTQVYQNLIVNALKFTVANRRPQIAFTGKTDGRTVVLGVKDNGIGIDPGQREYVFQPLARLHSRDEFDGTGIGLAICKKAVERMGGRIWIEGENNNGSHFQFELKAG